MGMSASQARYLQLTARKSNVEFMAQQINQARLMLAQRSEQIATAYNNEINDRHLYFSSALDSFGKNTSTLPRLTYSDIVRSAIDENPGMGMRLVNAEGKIIAPAIPEGANADEYEVNLNCLSSDYLENMLRDGTWLLQEPVTQTHKNVWTDADLVNNESLLTSFIESISKPDKASDIRLLNSDGRILVKELPENADTTKYVVDANIGNQEYVLNKLKSGDWSAQQFKEETTYTIDWVDTIYYTKSQISDLLNEENDSAASAQYTQETQAIQRQDKALELKLSQLTSEQKSLDTELDSVKKVLDKNVETSFKTFG